MSALHHLRGSQQRRCVHRDAKHSTEVTSTPACAGPASGAALEPPASSSAVAAAPKQGLADSLLSGTRYLLAPLSRLGGALYTQQKQPAASASPRTAPPAATREALLAAAAAAAAQAHHTGPAPSWGSGAHSQRAAFASVEPPPAGSAAASQLHNGAGGWDERGLSIRVEDSAQHRTSEHGPNPKRTQGTAGASWRADMAERPLSPRSVSPVPEHALRHDRSVRFF